MRRFSYGAASGFVMIWILSLAYNPCRTALAETLLFDDFSTAFVRFAPDTYGMGTVSSAANWVAVNGANNPQANPPIPTGNLSISDERMTFAPYDSGGAAVGALQGFAGTFTPKTLSNIGDSITLTFDFAFASQPNTIKTGGGAAGGFRFGLFNDAGTALLDNDGNQDVDDFGYRVGISVVGSPTNTGSRIAREAGTDPNAAVGSGTDNAYFSPDPGAGVIIPSVGADTHTAILSVTKTQTSAIVAFTYDGVLQWSKTDATNPAFLSFNEVAVVQNAIYTAASGGNPAISPNGVFSIDNVSVLFALPAVRGDANGDNVVDFSDLGILLNNYNQPGGYTNGDFDANGTVEFSDLGLLLNDYNQPVLVATQAAPVPEPSTLVLVAIGACGLWRRRRRI